MNYYIERKIETVIMGHISSDAKFDAYPWLFRTGFLMSTNKIYKVKDRMTGKFFDGFKDISTQIKDKEPNLQLSDNGRIYDKPNTPKAIVTKMRRIFKSEEERILFCKYDLEVIEYDLIEIKK